MGNTKIYMEGEEVREFHVHAMGEVYYWFEGITKSGRKIQTLPIKGSI